MSRTLKTIRREAPEPDRREPALTRSPEPHWAKARDGTAYVHINLFPRTLDELRKQCREFGDAAVADLKWHCVLTWLMNQPHETDLTNPYRVAQTAVLLVRDQDRVRLGYPRHDGRSWDAPFLDALSPELREEAERTAAETRCDWAKAGRQYLGERAIRLAYKHLVSCPPFASKYL
jgi:hypothetical protein